METVERASEGRRRYWVGWTSRHEQVDTPYPKWKTRASRVGRAAPGQTLLISYCAVIDAEDRERAWHEVAGRFPDASELFVREKAKDYWPPRDRFPSPSTEFRAAAESLVSPSEGG